MNAANLASFIFVASGAIQMEGSKINKKLFTASFLVVSSKGWFMWTFMVFKNLILHNFEVIRIKVSDMTFTSHHPSLKEYH